MRYEIMVLAKPYTETPETRINSIIELVTKCGGTNITVEDWKTRSLAYEIDGYSEGHYMLCKFNTRSKNVLKEIDLCLKHNELVLKHLICREIKSA